MSAPALAGATPRVLSAAAAVAVLALAGLSAAGSVRPPAARDASAPASEFSAARAFAQVEAIATEPHPVGSAAQDRVRDHLLATLRGLGLTPEVQDTVSVQGGELSSSAGGTGLAHVRNIVALLPGTASTGRVLLVTHYDSVQTGPGANDDGAGTATLLETARALAGGPRPRNDVVFLFTDGEEACLCGAQAFVDQHPLARGGGVVLNVEARGSTGPAIMFETSADNRRLIDVYAGAPRPVGTSFGVEIYRRLPNDTDFTPFREAGFAGLNAAYIDGAAVYHAPTDVPASMARDSLQHHGGNTLAVARDLGGRDLAALRAGQDATYFPAPAGLVRYPGLLVWPIAVLALAAVGALAWLARRRRRTNARRLLRAALFTAAPVVVAPLLAQLLWRLLVLIRPGYAQMRIDPYHPGWYRLAVVALTAAVLLAWYALLRRRVGPATLAVAGLGWLAGLGVVLAAFAPGGSYLAALPALAGAAAGAGALYLRGWWSVLAVTAGGAVAVLVLVPTVIMLFPALGLRLGAVVAFLVVLLGLALLPVLDLLHPVAEGSRGLDALRAARQARVPALAAVVAALVCTGVGLAVDRFDAQHPVPTQLMYALDADAGTAQWLSEERTTQKWTAQYVKGDPHRVDATLPGFGPAPLRTGPAQPTALPAPQLTLLSDTRSGDTRVLRLRVRSQRPVRLVTLHVAAGVRVTGVRVAGRPVTPGRAANDQWGSGLVFHAPPAEGVEVAMTAQWAGPVKFRVMDGSDGLSGLPGFRDRPAGVGVAGSHTSELCSVARTYTL